jgi:hypothetical protein
MLGALVLAGMLAAGPTMLLDDASWVVGIWTQDLDEDGAAGDETVQLWPDGRVALFDSGCRFVGEATYFVRDAAVFVVATTAKGRVAIVYELDRKTDHLRFTSPRTRNLATYARSTACVPAPPPPAS